MKYKAYSKEFKLDALNLVKTNGAVEKVALSPETMPQ